ncbi:MAG: FAD-dependent oxidoreductase [Mycoplasmoidaceae bacterium]|nr:FAD-dependent oxidoreductase [Mycoplasmoidaceae bacterium]
MGLELEVVGETNKFDVIVIGGGIAGMTASSIVTQSGMKSCFLERDVPGGKLMQIEQLHNFPSNPNISGKDLALSIFKQATEEIKTIYVYGDVQAIRPKNGLFYLFTADGQTWEAKAIIVAVGTGIKKLNVDGEEKYFNRGLSYCAVCDGALAKGKDVALIGFSQHLDFLKKYASKVDVYQAQDIKSIDGNDKELTGITTIDGTKHKYNFVFVENGNEPKTSFLPSEIEVDDKKQLVVDGSMASPYFEGVFGCGDCINNDEKLVTLAMQQASIAADSAIKYIKSKK